MPDRLDSFHATFACICICTIRGTCYLSFIERTERVFIVMSRAGKAPAAQGSVLSSPGLSGLNPLNPFSSRRLDAERDNDEAQVTQKWEAPASFIPGPQHPPGPISHMLWVIPHRVEGATWGSLEALSCPLVQQGWLARQPLPPPHTGNQTVVNSSWEWKILAACCFHLC